MDEKNWQDKTDETLERIESQGDSSNKQEGFALNFREKVLLSLRSIEDSLKKNGEDHQSLRESFTTLKACTDKIPAMELGLNNHLHSHDTFRKYVMYPILVSIAVASLGIFAKVVLHVF